MKRKNEGLQWEAACPLSRRSVTALLAAGAGGLLLPDLAFAEGQGKSRRGGVLRFPVPGDADFWPLNPGGSGVASYMANTAVFSKLVYHDGEGYDIVPGLADSWESSSDGLIWTFMLNPNATWHDGRPVTAEDVRFTFESILNPAIRVRFRRNVGSLQRVEVADPHTVRFHFKVPYAPLLTMLANHGLWIIPKHLLEGVDLNNPGDFRKKPVGSGPFKFHQAASGSHCTVTANDAYFRGRPALDSVIFRVEADSNARMAKLRAGDLDMIGVELGSDDIEVLKSIKTVKVSYVPQLRVNVIILNNKNALFADKRVRQAMAHGVDQDNILKSFADGLGKLATGPIPPSISWAYTDRVRRYPYDPAKARQMLKEAGWEPDGDGILRKDGKAFKFDILMSRGKQTERLPLIAQQHFKALGMDVGIEAVDAASEFSRILKGDFDVSASYYPTTPDPDNSLTWASTGGANTSKLSDPEVDALLAQAVASTDQKKRAETYHKLQQVMAELVPMIFLYQPTAIRAISNRVKGFGSIDTLLARLDKVYLER